MGAGILGLGLGYYLRIMECIVRFGKPDSESTSVQILEAGCLDQLSQLEELKLSRNRLSSLPKMVIFLPFKMFRI